MVTVFESLKSAIASILRSISTESCFWSTVAVSYFRLLPNAIASHEPHIIDIYWHLLTFIDIYWHLLTYFKYFHYSQSRGPSFLQHRMQHPHRLTSRQGFFPGWKSEALTLRFTWSWRNQESSKMFKALASVAPEVAKQLPSQTRFVLLFHLAHQSLSGWSSEETTLTWKLKTSKTHYDQIWLIWSVIISVGSRRWPFLPTASPSGSTFLKSDCTHPLTASWLRCNLGPDTT